MIATAHVRRTRVALRPLSRPHPGMEHRWRRLAAQAAEPNPFAGPDLVLPAVRHLPGGRSVRLLTVERGDEMIFALPVTRHRAHRLLPVPILGPWRQQHFPLATPLLHPGHAESAWHAVRAALGTGLRAAWLRLDPITADGPAMRALNASVRPGGLGPQHRETWQRGAVLRGSGPPEPSGRTRRGLARRRRRLAEELDTELQVGFHAGADHPPADLTDRFLTLEASGWKGRAGTALRDAPGQAAFFREMSDRHREHDALEFVTLEAGPRLLAASVNLIAAATVFCLKTAYDEEFRACTPGRLIVEDHIRLFFAGTAYTAIDTCASPASQVANQMFPGRITLSTVLVPGTTTPSQLVTRAVETARNARA